MKGVYQEHFQERQEEVRGGGSEKEGSRASLRFQARSQPLVLDVGQPVHPQQVRRLEGTRGVCHGWMRRAECVLPNSIGLALHQPCAEYIQQVFNVISFNVVLLL